jgi:transcriptional regulator with XRE-family HTH domain
MDLKEVMAINMRRLRYDKKLTQEELAERSGLSMRYIGSIERGAVSASVSVLGKVAVALDVDPCDLIRAQKR